MAYSFKGSITFGMVYIPITLYTTVKNNDISFNMLEKKTQSRVQYKKTCVDCGDREIKQDDIVKAYQYEKGKYVIFEDGDFEKIKRKRDKTILIEQFVSLADIDPIYYDKAYYVAPEQNAARAYALLRETMQSENKVGIAKTMIGSKECLAALRIKDGQMLLSTMFFEEEIQQNPAPVAAIELNTAELNIAKGIINGMTQKFEPKSYKDEYRQRLYDAILQKINGKEIEGEKEGRDNKVVSLMDALQRSLNNITKKGAVAGARGNEVRGTGGADGADKHGGDGKSAGGNAAKGARRGADAKSARGKIVNAAGVGGGKTDATAARAAIRAAAARTTTARPAQRRVQTATTARSTISATRSPQKMQKGAKRAK